MVRRRLTWLHVSKFRTVRMWGGIQQCLMVSRSEWQLTAFKRRELRNVRLRRGLAGHVAPSG